ncbi:MAG: hypothetical protein LBR77_09345 [Lachnospiraceae bacterium]|jgi:hypothetical protein|nr:hypothetical protein [Lachnospiraceae bacterium]
MKKSQSFKKAFGDGHLSVPAGGHQERIPVAKPTVTFKDAKHKSRQERKADTEKELDGFFSF